MAERVNRRTGIQRDDEPSASLAEEAMAAVNQRIAQRIRIARAARGMSQADLAAAVGLTLCRLQAHERGASPVGAARLATIAWALGCPVTDFLDASMPHAGDGAVGLPDHETRVLARDLAAIPLEARLHIRRMIAMTAERARQKESGPPRQ